MTAHSLTTVVRFSFRTFAACWLATTLLSACATPTKPEQEARGVEPEEVYKVQVEKRKVPTSYSYIQKAKQQAPNQARSYYIQAAKYAINEGKSTEFVSQIIDRIDVSRYNSVSQDIELTKALLFIDSVEQAQTVLARLQQGNLPRKHRLSLWIIKAQIEAAQKQHIKVVQTIFRIYDFHRKQLSASDETLLNNLLWHHINKIPEATLAQFQLDFGGSADAWLSLARIIKRSFADPVLFPKQLQNWQREFPKLSQSPYLPQAVKQITKVQPFNPKRIALLLPFTGKLERQAKAIRNGVLAATKFDSSLELRIFDTGKYSIEEIEQQLVDGNIEFIIGPLEKNKVSELQQSQILGAIPTLYLNLPREEMVENNPLAYYFSLAPEDEIDQAVEFLLDNEIKKPAVIYADNTLGRRLSEQFMDSWQRETEQAPEMIAFKSKSKLGEAVESLLDVDSSKARIRQMKTLFGPELETSPRSRTDIDAVYVIANSQQTRLIKPFFDVNVSVFGARLPIYGSSRSYLVDESKSQKRDLNDLTFTEMPWLIRGTHPELHQLYAKIGEQQTQLKKLFAFGFDAFQLVYTLRQLEAMPIQTIHGLTGRLKVLAGHRIKRTLDWSRYQQGRIIAVAQMD